MANPGDEHAAGAVPEEPTPEGLRLEAEVERRVGHMAQASAIDDYASAWEAGLRRLDETAAALGRMSRRWADGQTRIEELEQLLEEGRASCYRVGAFDSWTERVAAALSAKLPCPCPEYIALAAKPK